jgi:hypothetical protein
MPFSVPVTNSNNVPNMLPVNYSRMGSFRKEIDRCS